MTCGIYMIQNKKNNKIYIGQAINIEKRWKDHKRELCRNHHDNKHLQRTWNRDGEDSFDFKVLCKCDENQLNTLEQYYIFELMTYDDRVGYNKNYGGASGRPTEEARKKMSEALKGERSPNYGKHLSEETKMKIGEALRGENNYLYGKHLSEETKKKLSDAKKGEKNYNYGKHRSEETKKKIGEANKGRILSEEQKKKLSEAHKGKTLSEEHRKKISDSTPKGAKNPSSIPVVQLGIDSKLVNVYGSAGEVGRNGFNQKHITHCCQGKRKTHGGYKWMYLHDYISNIHPNIKTINLFGKTYEVNQEEVK